MHPSNFVCTSSSSNFISTNSSDFLSHLVKKPTFLRWELFCHTPDQRNGKIWIRNCFCCSIVAICQSVKNRILKHTCFNPQTKKWGCRVKTFPDELVLQDSFRQKGSPQEHLKNLQVYCFTKCKQIECVKKLFWSFTA